MPQPRKSNTTTVFIGQIQIVIIIKYISDKKHGKTSQKSQSHMGGYQYTGEDKSGHENYTYDHGQLVNMKNKKHITTELNIS